MRPLDRASPLPLWAQLAAELRERIAAGEFDQRFPTDEELVHDYEVSRQTVREAVRHLGDAGIVERQRGRGSFLRRPSSLEQPLRALYSLARSITEQGLRGAFACPRSETVVDAEAASRLRLPPGAALTYLERLRFAGDEPLAPDRSWLPAEIGEQLDAAELERGALHAMIAARTGFRVTGGHERISAAVPDDSDAPPPQPPGPGSGARDRPRGRRRGASRRVARQHGPRGPLRLHRRLAEPSEETRDLGPMPGLDRL